ncbi:YesL family protein [Peribacillus loiseleuriae]|uniref:Integral membrane protein n=1 Tax=Peribacillus loiseleuriae TaxID=1679170 RepID=A0A0K9GWF9_9BACI|nr:DUF624 domain-containing protein [Peribacillus loiseleuriae]KMY50973.1 hypothetical protein AC625_16750 [Peribacillus loiseleuriae]
MNLWEGKTAAFLKTGSNIILLNLLWLTCSIPIITIGPSTVALTGVIRRWHLNKEESVVRCFFYEYQKYLKQGFLVGTTWIFLGVILLIDVIFFLQIQSESKVIFIAITAIVIILYLMISTLLFPILVHYESKGLASIKQAFIFSLWDVKTAIAIILMWIAAGLIIFYAPIGILVIFVPLTMVTFRFATHVFLKVESIIEYKSASC